MKFRSMKFWSCVALVSFLAASCSDALYFDDSSENGSAIADGSVVITVDLQKQTTSSRADISAFSNGQFIDEIIFGVFEEVTANGETSYKLIDKQYTIDMNDKSWPYDIKFSVDPVKKYRVAFWAQKSNTDYYDTSDLTAVKVNYEKPSTDGAGSAYSGNWSLSNNDDLRDAFTATVSIINGVVNYGSPSANAAKVLELRRPFAQINIGTVGWDYEGAAKLEPEPLVITQSEITVRGVCQYFDAVQSRTLYHPLKYPLLQVPFNSNILPALSYVPTLSDDVKYTPYKDEIFIKAKLYNEGQPEGLEENWINKNLYTSHLGLDAFKYNLLGKYNNSDGGFFDYFSWDDYKNYSEAKGAYDEVYYDCHTVTGDKGRPVITEFSRIDPRPSEDDIVSHPNYLKTTDLLYDGFHPVTEVFKYLSMTYILVPEANTVNYGSSVVDIYLSFSGQEVDLKKNKYLDKFIETPEITIRNVPVQRNWSTNLLGNGFFVYFTAFRLYVEPVYRGGYNQSNSGLIDDHEWHGSEKDKPLINVEFKDRNGDEANQPKS